MLGGSSFLGVDFFLQLRETPPPAPESHFTLRDFLLLWMSVLGKTVKAGETGITGMEEGHPREQRTVMRDCQQEQQWPGRFGWERKTQPNLGIVDCEMRSGRLLVIAGMAQRSVCQCRTCMLDPCLGNPLEEDRATHSSSLAWEIPMDRGAWAIVHGVAKSWTHLRD